jgi:DUF1680 family protein
MTSDSSVHINGQAIPAAGSPGSYLAIHRVWKAGDRIEFVTPMQLRAESPRDDTSKQAFLYGPIVLAGQFPRDGIDDSLMHNQGPELAELPPFPVPTLSSASGDPEKWIRPVAGQPLTFRTVGQAQDVTLKPLNKSWDRFVVYWAITS